MLYFKREVLFEMCKVFGSKVLLDEMEDEWPKVLCLDFHFNN